MPGHQQIRGRSNIMLSECCGYEISTVKVFVHADSLTSCIFLEFGEEKTIVEFVTEESKVPQPTRGIPPRFIRPLESIQITETEETRLHVVVEGKPAPKFTWKLNGVPLEYDHRFTIESTETTTTIISRQPIPGEYTVTAVNEFGQCSSTSTVRVTKSTGEIECG